MCLKQGHGGDDCRIHIFCITNRLRHKPHCQNLKCGMVMSQVGPCRTPAPKKIPLLRSWVLVVIHSWTSCVWVDFLTWCGSLAVAFYCPCFGRCNKYLGGVKPHKSGSFFSGKSFKFGHFFIFKCLPALVTVACLQRCLVANPSSFYFLMFWFL